MSTSDLMSPGNIEFRAATTVYSTDAHSGSLHMMYVILESYIWSILKIFEVYILTHIVYRGNWLKGPQYNVGIILAQRDVLRARLTSLPLGYPR